MKKKTLLRVIPLCLLGLTGPNISSQIAGTPYISISQPFAVSKCSDNGATLGWLAAGLPANSADIAARQKIQITVFVPGSYNFTTPVVNGVSFSGSGTYATAGIYNLELTASGTPVNYSVDGSSYPYKVTSTNVPNAGSCSFTRNVYLADQGYNNTNAGTGNHRFIYKVITGPSGKEWLQTNLGALYNKVGHPSFNPEMYAQSTSDYLAYGSLFQAGRKSDGHELTNWTNPFTPTFVMGTTTVQTINPTATNSGLFIISGNPDASANGGDLQQQVMNGSVHAIGPYQPCPDGFLPSGPANFVNNENIPYAGTTADALSGPLKLVAPTVFRSGEYGTPVASISGTAPQGRLLRSNQVGFSNATISNPKATLLSPQFLIGNTDPYVLGSSQSFMDARFYISNYTDYRGMYDGYAVRCYKP